MLKKNQHKTKNYFIAKASPVMWAALFLALPFFGGLFFPAEGAVNCNLLTGDAKKKCKDLEEKAKTYRNLIDIKNKQQATIQSQMALIDSEQARNTAELKTTQEKVKSLGQQITDLNREIISKEEEIKYQKSILAGLMQVYYDYDQQGVLEVVLLNKNFSEVISQADYTEQAGSRVTELLIFIREAKDALEKKKQELQVKKEEIEKSKEELQDRNLDLQYTENKKQTLLSQTRGEEKKYKDMLAKVLEEQEAIARELDDLEAGKSGLDLGALPPSKSGVLAYPVNPVVITQSYGKTSFSKNYPTGRHNGIDFGINYSAVYAAQSGKVLATGNSGRYAYGKWIAIDHGNGLVTLYGHFSKQLVSKGESVKLGQKIGISGNTGFSTGPHLHFTVFAKKTFEIVESQKVSGVMLPTGVSLNPKNYL